ncbi:dynein regulatory complex protein 10-like [Exaiptasia diaphana]|uniref:Dynein regulatory complex protein 10 n=1 Tax=Exaiptasia diaphana TaxID=2652724 RepID=A0A913YHU0_EXADI|nr:dynein regulatory complex protein 10-like [Exaiptasia diaphana]
MNFNPDSPTRGLGAYSPHPSLPKSALGDACKILEPTRKTIQTLEAQRLIAVLEDTIHRLELVMALQQVLQQLPRFKIMLGTELVDLMENHDVRQRQYQVLVGRLQKEDLRIACAERRSLIDKGIQGDGQEVFVPRDISSEEDDVNEYWQMMKKDTAISEQGLKYSLLDLLRYFKKNPKAVENILALKLPCAPAYRTFLDYMEQLMTIMKERLLTFPSEELRRKKMIIDIFMRERKTNATKEKLEAKYIDAVKEKEAEISERNSVITQLKNELSMLDKITRDNHQKMLSDAIKQCSFDAKSSKTKKTRIRDEMLSIKKELRDHSREHREAETSMRKRTFKIGTEVFNWVQKYDADMGGRQDEYDRINKQYEGEKEDLSELENRFKTIEEQYDAIVEERKLALEAAQRKEEELRRQSLAVTKIAALWKGYIYRKNLKKKAQKGKGGKKDGRKRK